MNRDKMLIINPGSTSTKISVYQDGKEIFETNLHHSETELASFNKITDQLDYRMNMILNGLKENNISTSEFVCISARGGMLKPIPGGTYEVDESMCQALINAKKEHASNLGALIGKKIADTESIKAYVVDPVVVDEMSTVAKMTGIKGVTRLSIAHMLNQKAVARRSADKLGKKYEDANIIVCHMGGGVSVGIHDHGQVVDINNALDGDGPMSPERAGSIPNNSILDMVFNEGLSEAEIRRKLVGGGGFVSLMGTNDALKLENMMMAGDADATLAYQTLAYQCAKDIAAVASVVCGNVDAIALTGGLARSKPLVEMISERISFIAPIHMFPGEHEMEALYLGAMRVINGEEKPKFI